MIYCVLVEHEPQDQQGWGILVGLDSVTSGCLLLLLRLLSYNTVVRIKCGNGEVVRQVPGTL